MTTGSERRFGKRFGLKIPLRVSVPKSAAPERSVESLNISARGICFATDLPLRVGTPLQLVFEMPEEISHKPTSQWRCTGHVVHVQPNGSPQGVICVGVRFDCYEVVAAA
jgi:PilZ domain